MPLIDKKEVEAKLEENKNNKRNVKELDIVAQFKEEMDLLDEAQKEIDELYEDIHDHYLKVRNAKGTLMFTQSQTSNLVSLKTTKINIIRERINLKRSILDFELKCAPKEQDDDLDAALIGEILRQLNTKDAEEKIRYTDETVEEENSNEELEERLDTLEKEGKVTFNEIERNVSLEKEGANEIDVNAVVKDIMVNKQNYELSEEEKTLKKEKEEQFDWVYNAETDDVVKVPRKPSEEIVFVENNEENIEEEKPDFEVNPVLSQLMEQEEPEEEIEYVYEDEYDDEYEEECEIVVIADKNNYQNWEFAAIDKDGNIVDDYILPSKSVVKVTFQVVNGEVAPVDIYGEVYRLILK